MSCRVVPCTVIRLSIASRRELVHDLQRELDQFDFWKLRTVYGTVYITITREPVAGVSSQTYIELPASDAPAGSSPA